MNVLMLASTNEASGVVSCIASLTRGLIKYKNANVTIALNGQSGGGGKKAFLSDFNVIDIDFRKKNPISIVKNYRRLSKIIRENSIEIIHTHNRIPALYAAFYCCFHKKISYIWSNHLVPLKSDLINRLFTRYGKCAVAEGVSGEKMLVDDFYIPKAQVRVINLGTDLTSFIKTSIEERAKLKKDYAIDSSEKVLFLYGRLVPVKGHLFLIEALRTFADKKFKLVMPGSDCALQDGTSYKNAIIEKSKEYGLQDKLIFPGFVNGRDWLSISDLMVLPSATEGFGIVNVESFCCEVPVIRTKTGGYEDMADCCFGIEYGDVKGLSNLLGKFFEGDEVFGEKVKYAKRHIQRFGLEEMTNKYYQLYTDIVKSR